MFPSPRAVCRFKYTAPFDKCARCPPALPLTVGAMFTVQPNPTSHVTTCPKKSFRSVVVPCKNAILKTSCQLDGAIVVRGRSENVLHNEPWDAVYRDRVLGNLVVPGTERHAVEFSECV